MLTLLLIEPYAPLRHSLQEWLEVELSPCAVFAAADLAQALASASAQAPCVILIDLDTISSPEVDILLRLSQFCPCAAVGIGLDDTPAHRQRAYQSGVAAYVAKSQLQTDLVRVIQLEILPPA